MITDNLFCLSLGGATLNIVLKYILTNLKERKMRTAVMLLSILLSSMLLFVSFSIGESYESAQQKMARGMAGSATLAVSSADGTGLVPADARNTQFQQFMRDTVIADRFNGRITEYDLSIAFGSRVTVVGGFHIRCQYPPHGG